MGIKNFKKAAYMGASRFAMNPSVLRILSNPKVQKAFLTMLNANSEFHDWLGEQMTNQAKNLSLATHDEIVALQRELRHQGAELEIMEDRIVELHAKIAALEKEKAAPKKAAAKKAAPKKAAPKKAAPKKAATKKK